MFGKENLHSPKGTEKLRHRSGSLYKTKLKEQLGVDNYDMLQLSELLFYSSCLDSVCISFSVSISTF